MCLFVFVCVCVCLFVCLYVCVFVCSYVCLFVWLFVCVCVCVFVCVACSLTKSCGIGPISVLLYSLDFHKLTKLEVLELGGNEISVQRAMRGEDAMCTVGQA